MKPSTPSQVDQSERPLNKPANAGEVPAGDMPPQPMWPLIAASAAWGLWIVFLLVMMWMRVQTTSV